MINKIGEIHISVAGVSVVKLCWLVAAGVGVGFFVNVVVVV